MVVERTIAIGGTVPPVEDSDQQAALDDRIEDLRATLEAVQAEIQLAVDRGRHVTSRRRQRWALAAELTAEAARALSEDAADEGGPARVEDMLPECKSIDGLTFQQRRMLDLLTEGLTNAEIAAELHLSPKTVRNYFSSVFQVLGVSRRAAAAAHAASVRERARGAAGEPPADGHRSDDANAVYAVEDDAVDTSGRPATPRSEGRSN